MAPCNCGSKGNKLEYVVAFSDGTSKTFNTEVEAKIATQRKGGTYRAQTKNR